MDVECVAKAWHQDGISGPILVSFDNDADPGHGACCSATNRISHVSMVCDDVVTYINRQAWGSLACQRLQQIKMRLTSTQAFTQLDCSNNVNIYGKLYSLMKEASKKNNVTYVVTNYNICCRQKTDYNICS